MGLNIPVLNSCCCLSLRTAALIVGGIQVFFYSLHFVLILLFILVISLTTVLRHMMKFEDLISILLPTYVDVYNLVFSVILIIGIIKENSGFVVAWLLIELTRIMDLIWNTVFNSIFFYHSSFFIQELILIGGFELMCAWIGYSYYITMPKNNKYIF